MRAVRKKILYVGMVTKVTPVSTAATMTTATMNHRDPRDRAKQQSATTMRSVCTTANGEPICVCAEGYRPQGGHCVPGIVAELIDSTFE